MRGLTEAELRNWLATFGVAIKEHDDLEFLGRDGRRRMMLVEYPPMTPIALNSFVTSLVNWLPNGRDRVLWLRRWKSYPPDQMSAFGRIRRGCGEPRNIGDAPAHLFGSTLYAQFEERSVLDIEEESAMLAMILLVMCFDWDCYLLADKCGDYIHLSDEYVSFSSDDREKIDHLRMQMERLGYKVSWVKDE